MSEILIGLASAVIGFVSGLLVPWVKWQVEKQREIMNSRKAHIRAWRAAVDGLSGADAEALSQFMNAAVYSSLRGHMCKPAIEKLEAPRMFYVPGGRGGDVRIQILLDEVTRLEKEWRLV